MPFKGTPTWHLHTKLYTVNLCKKFFQISRIWNIAQTWFLARLFLLFILFHLPDSRLSVPNGLNFWFWWHDSENREQRKKLLLRSIFTSAESHWTLLGGGGGGAVGREGEEASLAQFLKCLMLETQIRFLSFWTSVPPLIWLTIKFS